MKAKVISTNRENGKTTIVMEKQLFFNDYYFFDIDGQTYGDMGFEFCDKCDTRNDDTLEKNIKGTREGLTDEGYYEDYDMKNEGQVHEIHRATFTMEETLTDKEIEELGGMENISDKLWHNCGAEMVEDTDKVVYSFALVNEDWYSKNIKPRDIKVNEVIIAE